MRSRSPSATGSASPSGSNRSPAAAARSRPRPRSATWPAIAVHADRVTGYKLSGPRPLPASARPVTCVSCADPGTRTTSRSSVPFPWALKDQVDATSGAFNHLTAGRIWTHEEIRAFGRNQVSETIRRLVRSRRRCATTAIPTSRSSECRPGASGARHLPGRDERDGTRSGFGRWGAIRPSSCSGCRRGGR